MLISWLAHAEMHPMLTDTYSPTLMRQFMTGDICKAKGDQK